jgi:ribosomal protein S18 acetylase RimI-like enzyme
MADLMFVDPSREAIGLAGSADRARRFQEGLLASAFRSAGNVVIVAEDAADLLGFALLSDGSDVPPLLQLTTMSVRAMGVWGALAAAWRSSARVRVDLRPPPGGLHIVELQIHPRHRGVGLGGGLLAASEEYARDQGAPHLSLTTRSTNPARPLYARHGFEVSGERSAKRYTRLTGVPGRVLMVKSLVT